jgi:hypothetical protein
LTDRFSGNRINHLQFHQPIPQHPQGPSRTPHRRLATGYAHQSRLAFTIEFAGAFASALFALERGLQTLADTPLSNLFNGPAPKANPFGDFAINQPFSMFTLIDQQQHLGMTPAKGRLSPPIHQALQLITLFG